MKVDKAHAATLAAFGTEAEFEAFVITMLGRSYMTYLPKEKLEVSSHIYKAFETIRL